MASLVIRNIEDALKERLRVRAARRGRSMEEEARRILRAAFPDQEPHGNLADLAEELFGKDGVDLDAHPAAPVRSAPDFDA